LLPGWLSACRFSSGLSSAKHKSRDQMAAAPEFTEGQGARTGNS
jgi:hypothetical protein